MDKVVRDGKVAVLYSPGFGSGWYSWNTSYKQCLFHPKIVEMVEAGRHDLITDEFCNELFGDGFYAGGAMELKIVWMPEGTAFHVDDYDGSESVETIESLTLIA